MYDMTCLIHTYKNESRPIDRIILASKSHFPGRGAKNGLKKKTSTIRKSWENIRFLHAIFPPFWADIARILGKVCKWLIYGTHVNESWHTWMRHVDTQDSKKDQPTQKSPTTWKQSSEFEFWGDSVCWKKSPTYDIFGEVGGWGRDPKKCTGRDWGMGSSTI